MRVSDIAAATAPLSPSVIYCHAAGVQPQGEARLSRTALCAMCARQIPAGELATHGQGLFDAGFNNKHELAAGASVVCGHCMALWGRAFMQTHSKTWACSKGVFKFASSRDQARLLFEPPQEPFVAILSTSKQQHLIWRTPVTYDGQRMIYVRRGDEVLSIRRELLINDALPAWSALLEMMAAQGMKGLPAVLDRELLASHMGQVRRDVAARAAERGLKDRVQLLNRLSTGEWWALNVLRQFDRQALVAEPFAMVISPAGVVMGGSGGASD